MFISKKKVQTLRMMNNFLLAVHRNKLLQVCFIFISQSSMCFSTPVDEFKMNKRSSIQ